MGLTSATNLFGTLALAACLGATSPPEAGNIADPFEAAKWAPSDISMYVHVTGAAAIRQEIADRPIARWINALLENGDIHKAWSRFAQAAQVDDGRLLDLCLGRNCSLYQRPPDQWAVVSEVDQEQIAALTKRLNVRVREPRAGMVVSELPEQDVLIARGGNVMVVGPAAHSELFYEILPRLEKPQDPEPTPQEWLKSARSLGGGSIGIFTRHERPLGGYSMAVAQLNGEQLSIRHAARFDHAPFNHGVTRMVCDFSPVLLFESRSLAAFMQPTDIGDGPVESFVAASLGEGLISPQIRSNLGDRRLIVIDEAEGRTLEQPVDLLSTTVVSCLQLKDRQHAVDQLDEQMVKVTRRIKSLGEGSFLVQTPRIRHLPPDQPREVDLSAATDWFTGGFPIMKNISLSWTVADGPRGSWFVVGSHRKSLDDVVAALKDDSPSQPGFVGRFDNCGTANGLRISRHLQSWSQIAPQFAEPEKVEDFRAAIGLMSELTGGMQSCRWRLARPSANEMSLDIQITLSPPESSRRE